MSTEPERTCPSCGNELSGLMEFCPVCMLRKGLAEVVESGESSASEDTVKPTTPEQAAHRFEHYELVTVEDGKPVELGRGAMGITFKAVDVHLQCAVALKVICAALYTKFWGQRVWLESLAALSDNAKSWSFPSSCFRFWLLMPANLPLNEMSLEEKLQAMEALWDDLSREPDLTSLIAPLQQ